MLLKALVAGALVTVPVIFTEQLMFSIGASAQFGAVWDAFAVAGLVEESFKFLAFLLIVWRNRNFNEKFDGIVYAVFIALGFAGIENIIYVAQGGVQVALTRAITAVPAHALFGVMMGYHMGLARFFPRERVKNITLAILLPIAAHGFYDFCLMSGNSFLLGIFVPYIVWLWIYGGRKMKELSESSIYRNDL